SPALEGAVMGSPHYLAPEQLEGGSVDARTDIHALGVVFYELLTLRKAFSGDSVEQITTAVLSNHPARAHEIREGVPRTLSAIAAKAMARDPADRFTSAAELATELRRWYDRNPAPPASERPSAPQPSVDPGHTRPRRKRGASRYTTPVLAVCGLLALLGLGTALWLARPMTATTTAQVPQPEAAPVLVPSTQSLGPSMAPSQVDPLVAAAPSFAADEPSSATTPATGSPQLAADAVYASPIQPTAPSMTGLPRPTPATTTTVVTPAKGSAQKKAPVAARDTKVPPVAAASTGQLQLAISPWGQVEIDGAPAGTTPPLTRLTLPEGSHTITVRNEDFAPFTTTVHVTADKPVTVRHRFGP
ncbi:MAG TPA: PEGA domain-containing protein, partial [Rubrivivax sp.]|nr:PEGA domain-containing protein [Rubrivivax sp.]